MTHALIYLALAALGAAGAEADDWPEFRGPGGLGVARSKNLPTEWSANRNVAWATDLPGAGWSSPVVAGGKVYLTAAADIAGSDDLSLRVLCLDAKTGKVVWNEEALRQGGARAPKIHAKNSHASPTPVVAGGRVYAHFGHQGTACLDLDGKVLWANRDLAYNPVHGNGGSPVLVDGLLIFSTDGAVTREVVALDAKTGKLKWRQARPGFVVKRFSFSTPLVISVGGGKQVVSSGSDVVTAHEPATGKELWRVSYRGFSVITRPVYGHGLVFLSTGYEGSPEVLAIDPTGRGDVTKTHVKWRLRKGAPNTPSPLLVGDELYLVSDNGLASCVEAKTGKVHWAQRLKGAYSASPIAAGGRVYFLSEDGVGTVIKAGKTFARVAENRLGERALASYAAAGDGLLIRTEKRLYRVGK